MALRTLRRLPLSAITAGRLAEGVGLRSWALAAQPGVRDQQHAWQAVPGLQIDLFHRTFASSGSIRTSGAEVSDLNPLHFIGSTRACVVFKP